MHRVPRSSTWTAWRVLKQSDAAWSSVMPVIVITHAREPARQDRGARSRRGRLHQPFRDERRTARPASRTALSAIRARALDNDSIAQSGENIRSFCDLTIDATTSTMSSCAGRTFTSHASDVVQRSWRCWARSPVKVRLRFPHHLNHGPKAKAGTIRSLRVSIAGIAIRSRRIAPGTYSRDRRGRTG